MQMAGSRTSVLTVTNIIVCKMIHLSRPKRLIMCLRVLKKMVNLLLSKSTTFWDMAWIRTQTLAKHRLMAMLEPFHCLSRKFQAYLMLKMRKTSYKRHQSKDSHPSTLTHRQPFSKARPLWVQCEKRTHHSMLIRLSRFQTKETSCCAIWSTNQKRWWPNKCKQSCAKSGFWMASWNTIWTAASWNRFPTNSCT